MKLERAKGFEPSTPTLARLCSTPELRPLVRFGDDVLPLHRGVRRAFSETCSECQGEFSHQAQLSLPLAVWLFTNAGKSPHRACELSKKEA
jgi:hypothetical protein